MSAQPAHRTPSNKKKKNEVFFFFFVDATAMRLTGHVPRR
jgi:hypothetical protein